MPEEGAKRGINNKWSDAKTKNADEGKQVIILRAYYDMKEIEKAQSDEEEAEKNVESIKLEVQKAKEERNKADDDRKRFQRYRITLNSNKILTELNKKDKDELKEKEKSFTRWPKAIKDQRLAMRLKEQQYWATVRRIYTDAAKVKDELIKKETEVENLIKVEKEDINVLRKFQSEQIQYDSKIRGGNCAAKIKQLGDLPVEVYDAADGRLLQMSDGEISITSAVEIKVPGVMEMQLMPNGVDVYKVRSELKRINDEINSIYTKYNVRSLEELEEKENNYNTSVNEIEKLKSLFALRMGDYNWESVESEYQRMPEGIPDEEAVKQQINDLCGSKNVDIYIGELNAEIEGYVEKFENTEKLNDAIQALNESIKDRNEKIKVPEEMPEEYKGIKDPEEFNEELESRVEKLYTELSRLKDDLRDAEKRLGEKTAEEYAEDLQRARSSFEEKKKIYGHWKHISNEFTQLKKSLIGNPMKDIEENFKEYLNAISDGRVSLELPDEKMSVILASGNHALTYETLSNGTRDTVSLAFRLAMLEHLYPNGGGIVVFDDPFTDMDPKRVEQSCKLLSKYAENNQVIFITCDGKYKDLLSGKVISV